MGILRKIRNLFKKPEPPPPPPPPFIQYMLDGVEITLPYSHKLPSYRQRFPEYGKNIGRLGRYVQEKYPDMTLIDIGANIGDTVAILRAQAHYPILCVEGDGTFLELLHKNLTIHQDVEVEESFVGDTTQVAGKVVLSNYGTATIIKDTESTQTIPLKRLSQILKEHPRFIAPRLIKIDTDGFDVPIIKAEINLLQEHHSVVFFEYDPALYPSENDKVFEVFKCLAEVGYTQAIFYNNYGDYVLTANLAAMNLLEDVHLFYSWRTEGMFCDVCVFHQDDDELCQAIRRKEIQYFRESRFNDYVNKIMAGQSAPAYQAYFSQFKQGETPRQD